MEKRRFDLCLCGSDPVYVERLMSYIHRKPNFLFTVLGFTKPTELLLFLNQNGSDLVLIDERFWRDLPGEEKQQVQEKSGCLILLSDRHQTEGDIRSVCRYQSAEKLLHEVVSYFEEMMPEEHEAAEKTQIDAFYSPDGNCGQTTCALLLGHRLAENEGRSVLYMNLEALAGGNTVGRRRTRYDAADKEPGEVNTAEAVMSERNLNNRIEERVGVQRGSSKFSMSNRPETGRSGTTAQLVTEGSRALHGVISVVRERSSAISPDRTAEMNGHSLSDLLYHRKNNGRGTMLQSLTTSNGLLSVLAPVVNPEDMWSLSDEELKDVLTEIRDRGIYDSVILDMGRERNPEAVFAVCKRVFLIEESRGNLLTSGDNSRKNSEISSGSGNPQNVLRQMNRSQVETDYGRMDHFLEYAEQKQGTIPEHWHRIRPPFIPELEGRLPGTRCAELETWLEKEWASCS